MYEPECCRLLYERVPVRKSAEMMLLHLDDPVTEFLPLRGASRRHGARGKLGL